MCRHTRFRVRDNVCEFLGQLELECSAGLYQIGRNNNTGWSSLRAFLRIDHEELKEFFRLYGALAVKGTLTNYGYEPGEGRVEVTIQPQEYHPVAIRVTMGATGPDKDVIPFTDWGNQFPAHIIADRRAKNAP